MKIDLTRVLYPARCPLCDGVLRSDERYICRKCAEQLKFLREPVCAKCGKPLESDDEELCRDCRRRRHSFESGFAPFLYTGKIQSSMMRLKYGGRAEFAEFYAEAMWRYGRTRLLQWRPDLMIPIPIHRQRYVKRGYNQAEEIASHLSARCGIPMDARSLVRVRNTRPQKGLSRKERRDNMKAALAVREGTVYPARVLIVDDIYTTGSTIDAAAEVVKKHGAETVWFATAAVGGGLT